MERRIFRPPFCKASRADFSLPLARGAREQYRPLPLGFRDSLLGQAEPAAASAVTKGRPGGNEPTGNFAVRSPARHFSAASRKAPTNAAYISHRPLRTALVAAWNAGAGDFFVQFGRVCGFCRKMPATPRG